MVDTGIDNGINLLCELSESYMAKSTSSRRIQRLGRRPLYFQAGFVPYPVKEMVDTISWTRITKSTYLRFVRRIAWGRHWDMLAPSRLLQIVDEMVDTRWITKSTYYDPCCRVFHTSARLSSNQQSMPEGFLTGFSIPSQLPCRRWC